MSAARVGQGTRARHRPMPVVEHVLRGSGLGLAVEHYALTARIVRVVRSLPFSTFAIWIVQRIVVVRFICGTSTIPSPITAINLRLRRASEHTHATDPHRTNTLWGSHIDSTIQRTAHLEQLWFGSVKQTLVAVKTQLAAGLQRTNQQLTVAAATRTGAITVMPTHVASRSNRVRVCNPALAIQNNPQGVERLTMRDSRCCSIASLPSNRAGWHRTRATDLCFGRSVPPSQIRRTLT